ncbi:hypothetical protein BHM03_00003664 [Ensete ventricosum]|nr:hypothetical protein BHM03_00003664 [Ensete ventricosum]
MAAKFKMFRNAGQSQRFRFVVLVVGCFLVSMTFIVVSRPLVFPSLGSRLRPQKSGEPPPLVIFRFPDVEPKKAADSSSPFSAPFMREDEQTTRQSGEHLFQYASFARSIDLAQLSSFFGLNSTKHRKKDGK